MDKMDKTDPAVRGGSRTVQRWLRSGGIVAGVLVALVAAFVVGMMAGSGGVVAGGSPVPTPSATPSPSATRSPSATPSQSPTEAAGPARAPVALFVGDSYTVGQMATPVRRWSTVVAREMGWTELNVAIGGTGFVSRYPHQSRLSYAEQVAAVRNPWRVDIVVIAGGQNDFDELRTDPAPVFEAVSNTYAAVAQRFPDARVIAVGPSTPWEIGLEARAMDSAVRAAAQEHEATYVSLLDPDVVRDSFVSDDGVHVTDQGHRAIADRVLAQIS